MIQSKFSLRSGFDVIFRPAPEQHGLTWIPAWISNYIHHSVPARYGLKEYCSASFIRAGYNTFVIKRVWIWISQDKPEFMSIVIYLSLSLNSRAVIVVIDHKIVKVQRLQLPHGTENYDFWFIDIYHQPITVMPFACVIQTRLKFAANLFNTVTTCVNNCVNNKWINEFIMHQFVAKLKILLINNRNRNGPRINPLWDTGWDTYKRQQFPLT